MAKTTVPTCQIDRSQSFCCAHFWFQHVIAAYNWQAVEDSGSLV